METLELLAEERRRLADTLDGLTADEWDTPSRCRGWSAHVVAAHLNAGPTVSIPRFALAMARSLGNFDRANDALARDLAAQLDAAACVAALRANAEHPFRPPGMGHEAPLTDVLVHGGDILQPLGRQVADIDPEALRRVLTFVTGPKAGHFGAVPLGSVTLVATDLDGERFGSGADDVEGPASTLIDVALGRATDRSSLDGPGLAHLPPP